MQYDTDCASPGDAAGRDPPPNPDPEASLRPSPPERVSEYRRRGWWRGQTVDALFRAAVASRGAAEALIDAPNRQGLVGTAPRRLT